MNRRKLKLTRATIRLLEDAQTRGVVGGVGADTKWYPNSKQTCYQNCSQYCATTYTPHTCQGIP